MFHKNYTRWDHEAIERLFWQFRAENADMVMAHKPAYTDEISLKDWSFSSWVIRRRDVQRSAPTNGAAKKLYTTPPGVRLHWTSMRNRWWSGRGEVRLLNPAALLRTMDLAEQLSHTAEAQVLPVAETAALLWELGWYFQLRECERYEWRVQANMRHRDAVLWKKARVFAEEHKGEIKALNRKKDRIPERTKAEKLNRLLEVYTHGGKRHSTDCAARQVAAEFEDYLRKEKELRAQLARWIRAGGNPDDIPKEARHTKPDALLKHLIITLKES